MRGRHWLIAAAVVLLLPIASASNAGARPDTVVQRGSSEQTTAIRYGPFDVPAASADGPGMISNLMVREGGCRTLPFCVDLPVEKPCTDCYITGITPNLVDHETGETINFDTGGMLHHVVNVNWSRPDTTCPPGPGPGIINYLGLLEGGNERTFASGNERSTTQAPPGYGMYVGAEDEWGFIVELMNMTPEVRQMDLEYTFTWTEDELKPLTPVWLDIDNCNDSEVDLHHGYSDTHADWTSTVDGEVIGIGGHVHDNGISISAENVTQDRPLCTSKAGYERGSAFAPVGPGAGGKLHPRNWLRLRDSDHPGVTLESYQGHIAGMSTCIWRNGRPISQGDVIRLHTQYNLGEMRHGHGAMGIMIAYVHES